MKTIKELEAERIIARSIDSSSAKLTSKLLSAQLSIVKDVLGLMKEIEKTNNGCWAFEELRNQITGEHKSKETGE